MMKHKFLFLLVLLGGLVFNSCIKEAESESVTNVRNSLANLNNANAQAALIIANSQAALDKAQSDLLAAQAKLLAAQAEEQALMNQLLEVQIASAKAELEAQLAEVEVRKAQAAADLKRIAAQLEIDLVNAKTQLIVAQQAYQSAVTAFDTYRANEILSLANTYTVVCSNLLTAKLQLITLETQKAGLENDLASLNSTKEEIIKNNNAEIESVRKIIAALKATMDMTPEEITVKLNEKMAELVTVNDTYTKALKAQTDAQTALADAELEFKDLYPYYIKPTGLLMTGFTSTQEVVSESGMVIVQSLDTHIALSPNDQQSSKNTYTYGYDFGNYDYAIAAITHPSLKKKIYDKNTGYACVTTEFWPETFDRAAASFKETAKLNLDTWMTTILEMREQIVAEHDLYCRYVAKADELLGDKQDQLVKAQEKAMEALDNANLCQTALDEYVALSTASDKVRLAEARAARDAQQTIVNTLNSQITTAKAAIGTPESYQASLKFYQDLIVTWKTGINGFKTTLETSKLEMQENQSKVDSKIASVTILKLAYDELDNAYMEAKILNASEPSEEHAAAEAAALGKRDEKFAEWQTAAEDLALCESNLKAASDAYQTALTNLNSYEQSVVTFESQLKRMMNSYDMNNQLLYEASSRLPDETLKLTELQKAYSDAWIVVQKALADDKEFLRLTEENQYAAEVLALADAEVAALQASVDEVIVTNFPQYTAYVTTYIPMLRNDLKDNEAAEKAYMMAYDDIIAQIENWNGLTYETCAAKERYYEDIAKLNELVEAGWLADNECKYALDAQNAANAEFLALSEALTAAGDIALQITMYNEQITAIQARTQKVLTDVNDYETMVAYLNAQIATQKEVVAANEAAAKLAKESLDRAISAGQQQ